MKGFIEVSQSTYDWDDNVDGKKQILIAVDTVSLVEPKKPMGHYSENINCRIWLCNGDKKIDVDESYDKIISLMNDALK